MTVYKVQTYHDQSGQWKEVASFRPDYRLGMMRLGRWWWFKTLIGVATNFVAAESTAYQQALLVAKRCRARSRRAWQIRIQRESTWTGKEVKETLWQDGTTLLKLKHIFRRK